MASLSPPSSPPPRPDLGGLRISDTARGGRRRGWVRWFFAAIGVALLISGALYAFRQQTPVVEVAPVRAATESRVALLNASGYVTPRRRATVSAKITARVEQVLTDEGMHVQEGQILARLDSSDAEKRMTSAKADREATSAQLADLRVNLANAERQLVRTKALREGGVTSQEALDRDQTAADSLRARIALTQEQVRAADARIQMVQQDLDNCIVRSPFTGIVVSKDAQRGEMVSPISAGGGFTRTGIATVVDMTSLEVEVDVAESYIARVKTAQPVTAILDAYPDWQIPSKVRTVIPTADRQKATVKVRISFDHLDPRILPDMGVKVTFLGDEPAKREQNGTVLVPAEAVRDEQGKKIVFRFNNGRVERRAVGLGGVRGSDQEIVAGLSAGDRVVVKGFDGLRDGAAAAVKE